MAQAKESPITVVQKPEQKLVDELGVKSWPIWTKEPSTFDWQYDEKEVCLFLEGEVTVKHAGGEVSFGKGDLVTFSQGLSCTWHVKKAVKKHYRFG